MNRILLTCALTVCFGAAAAQWQAGAPAPEARSRAAGAIIGDNFYYIGGEGGIGRNVTAWRYNVPANAWTPIADLPSTGVGFGGVSNVQAAAVGHRIYLPGGWTGNSGISRLAIYDSVQNSWSLGTNLPSARYAAGVAAIGADVYVVGGSVSEGNITNELLKYDTGSGKWTALAPMATSRQYAAVAAVNGMLFVAGGVGVETNIEFNTVEVYDPSADSWSSGPAMTAARGGAAMFNLLGEPYVVGGGWTAYMTNGSVLTGGSWGSGDSLNFGARTFAYAGNEAWLVKTGGWNGAFMTQTEFYNAVPEPATVAVLALGLGLLAAHRRRKA